MNFFWYILIGAVAGFAAGQITKGKGFGLFLNIVVGIIGGVLGGWLFGLMGITTGDESKIGHFIMSTVGAIVLLCVISLFRKKKN